MWTRLANKLRYLVGGSRIKIGIWRRSWIFTVTC